MKQPKHHSLFEVIGNNVTSVVIDVVFVLILAPLMGIIITLPQLTIAFVVLYILHFIKGYYWRRLCDHLLDKHRKRHDKRSTRTKR